MRDNDLITCIMEDSDGVRREVAIFRSDLKEATAMKDRTLILFIVTSFALGVLFGSII